jgi:C-terminal processing protease CtpA/Prc
VYSISKSDAGQQPHAAYDWDGAKFTPAAYISYPQRYGAAAAVMCDGTAVSVTMTAQPRVAVSAPVYEVIGNGIVYIRTPQSFTYQNDEKFDAMLPAGSDAQRERVVVLDLRSNGGGAAPMSMLRRWYSSDEVARALAPGTIHTSNSCFTTALWFNAGQSMAASLKAPIASPIRDLLQAQVDAIAATPPAHCSVQWITKRGAAQPQHRFTMRRQDPRQTRVIAIVDNHCGSDCEALTLALSRLPDTVIAGTSTAGVMGFSRPGMFVLPYSRVPFMLALQLTDPYGDSRSIDGYGIPVDVLLATAQAQSMDSVIALARALSN